MATYWAYHLMHRLGEERLSVRGEGDGFAGLIRCWATRSPGALQVLVVNAAYEQKASARAAALLGRRVTLRIEGLDPGAHFVMRHARVDASHSNVMAAWEEVGRPKWPDSEQLEALRRRDGLEFLEADRPLSVSSFGTLEFEFDLPMPSLSLIELRCSGAQRTADQGEDAKPTMR